MAKCIGWFFFFLLSVYQCTGQENGLFYMGAYGGQVSSHVGYIIPNNRVFPEIKSPSYQLRGSLLKYTELSRPRWGYFYKYPIVGFDFGYESFGNREALGGAISLIPNLSFYLIRKEKFNLRIQAGLGLAYLTKPFDKITNPENTINGSHLNFSTLTSLVLSYQLSDGIFLESGPSVTHYSNGNYAKPNVGANLPDWSIGLRYQPQRAPKIEDEAYLPSVTSRFYPFVRVGYGITEKSLDGPKYPILEGTAGLIHYLGMYNRIHSGFSLLYDNRAYRYQKHLELNKGKEFRYSTRYIWFVGHEFMFGHVGFLTEGGFYLNKFEGKTSILSAKIGFNFYLKNTSNHRGFMPYLGVYIHSSFGEAEFIELAAGYLF